MQLDFYWTAAGNPLKVSLTATVNGKSMSTYVNYNVKKPTATIAPTYGTIWAGPVAQADITVTTYPTTTPGRMLTSGAIFRGAAPGIKLTATLPNDPDPDTPPSGTGLMEGQLQWVQIINSSNTTVTTPAKTWNHSASTGLDGVYPYPSNEGGFSVNDSPNATNRNNTATSIHRDGSYDMYLMWKPIGTASMFVSLDKVSWSWSATATFGGTPVTGTVVAGSAFGATTVTSVDLPPTWVRNAHPIP